MLTSSRSDRVVSEVAGRLQGAFELDFTTAHILGSIFVQQDDKPLHQLKRRLADAYGVSWCFPSTNGTTILNILALMSACPPGGRVLVNRDAHSSVTAALIHGGFTPVYLVPDYDADLGLYLGPTVAGFEAALRRGPIDCVFLTSPNYFGIVGEIAGITARARELSLPVVVDAAHAPHFHFCRALPEAAEDLGADLVTQSTHKVATALSQGSLLLFRDERFLAPLYEHVNDLGFVSTSFSYPILASIELGVRQLVEQGDTIWSQAVERAERFREAVRRVTPMHCFGREQTRKAGFRDFDATRITLDVSATGLTGYEVERRLNREWIYPEMATLRHVLFLITPGTSDADLRRLLEAVTAIGRERSPAGPAVVPPPPPTPRMAVVPRAAKFAAKRVVPVREAIGEVSGETIASYPPGSAIIAAGEIVSEEAVAYLTRLTQSGAALRGASDPRFQTMKILGS